MQYRTLGGTGIKVSPYCLGGLRKVFAKFAFRLMNVVPSLKERFRRGR